MIRAILVFLVFSLSAEMMACTCIQEKASFSHHVKKALTDSDAVFIANVIDREIIQESEDYQSFMTPVVYTFEVISVYKGVSENRTIQVVSNRDGESCGYSFEIGQTYLVYARDTDYYSENEKIKTSFTTGLCDRNQVIRNVKKRELKILKRKAQRK